MSSQIWYFGTRHLWWPYSYRWEGIQAIRIRDGALGLSHFKLLRRLGCGDIGSVYLAELRGSHSHFAMKVLYWVVFLFICDMQESSGLSEGTCESILFTSEIWELRGGPTGLACSWGNESGQASSQGWTSLCLDWRLLDWSSLCLWVQDRELQCCAWILE